MVVVDPGDIPMIALTGRKAQCNQCFSPPVDSDTALAFFKYRGEGSHDALHLCAVCGFRDDSEGVHREGEHNGHYAHCERSECTPVRNWTPHQFTPHGAFEVDLYHDGCRGWG